MATPAHQVGGARDRVVQGPVPGVPHPPALQQQRGAGDFLGRDVANGSLRDPRPHLDGGMPRTSRRTLARCPTPSAPGCAGGWRRIELALLAGCIPGTLAPQRMAAGAALPAVQEQRKPKGIDLAEEDRKGEEGATEISPGGTPSSAVSCGRPPATSASWPSRSRGSTP